MHRAFMLLLSVLVTALAPSAHSQSPPNVNAVLAENKTVKLTQADLEAELLKLAPDMRKSFVADKRRVGALVENLLIMKTLAEEARSAAIDRDPMMERRVRMEADRLLAQAQLDRMDDMSGKEFDAKAEQFSSRARELYLLSQAKYRLPEMLSVSQIFIDLVHHTPADALALANGARAKLIAGADVTELARSISDDPASKWNGGRVEWFSQEQRDPAFSKAAFALKSPGDISEVVQTPAGYHVIRLEGRRAPFQQTFEQVKPEIMKELRAKYIDDRRGEKVDLIKSDASIKVNEPAIDALIVRGSDSTIPPVVVPPQTPAAAAR